MVPSGTQPADWNCGVNFLMPFHPSLDEIATAGRRCRVVEFFYADPSPDVVSAGHSVGALSGWQVGSANEALAAAAAGCDYVVAQGNEAGGHVRGRLGLDELLAQVLAFVQIPVVAAGGIATAERVAALLRSGADAVRVGTRFVACPESGAHPDYVRSILAATGNGTVITEWYDDKGDWPNAPHRVLRCSLEAAQQTGWRSTAPPYRGVDRDPADMAMYAGAGVGEVTVSEPAMRVVDDLMRLV
jgi:NAD(P)H-dependent flavin oxidoreductase YrpB (nitropropane dioxygenase family)